MLTWLNSVLVRKNSISCKNNGEPMSKLFFLFMTMVLTRLLTAGELDPDGTIKCTSEFEYQSLELGKLKLEEMLKGPPSKLPNIEELGRFTEEGPSFQSQLSPHERLPGSNPVYLKRFGVKAHSNVPSKENESYNFIFHVGYNHDPNDKSTSRTMHIAILQPSVTATSQAYFYKLPGQGITGFPIKPGETIVTTLNYPKLKYKNKKYKDEIITEIKLECTNSIE